MKKLCAVCQKEYSAAVDAYPTDGAKLTAVQEENVDPLLGQTLDGRYRVDELLGEGGVGPVYRAAQLTTSRPVTLKVLKRELASGPEVVRRSLREAQAVSVLAHPSTITVHDFGQTPDDLLHIAMEFLEGGGLTDAIREEAPIPVDRALGILAEAAGALWEAHDKGIVHRDIKPVNVLLAWIGGRPGRGRCWEVCPQAPTDLATLRKAHLPGRADDLNTGRHRPLWLARAADRAVRVLGGTA